MCEAARLQSFDDAFTFYTSDNPDKPTENIGVGLDMIGAGGSSIACPSNRRNCCGTLR